jgi:hypothetical protein
MQIAIGCEHPSDNLDLTRTGALQGFTDRFYENYNSDYIREPPVIIELGLPENNGTVRDQRPELHEAMK